MPREKENFRDQLERIDAKFPDAETLTIEQVCTYLGRYRAPLLRDKTFPAKKLGGKYIIPKVALARWLS